jgi:hypothetical protein
VINKMRRLDELAKSNGVHGNPGVSMNSVFEDIGFEQSYPLFAA